MGSKRDMTMWLMPSRQGLLSCSMSWPARRQTVLGRRGFVARAIRTSNRRTAGVLSRIRLCFMRYLGSMPNVYLSSRSLASVGAPGMPRRSYCFFGRRELSNRAAAQRGSLGAVAPSHQITNYGFEVRLALERLHQRLELRQVTVEDVPRVRFVHQAVDGFLVERALYHPAQLQPAGLTQTQ